MKDLNVLQAMRRYLLKHTVQMVHIQWTTEMKDRIDVLDWDKLSMYDQDDLLPTIKIDKSATVTDKGATKSVTYCHYLEFQTWLTKRCTRMVDTCFSLLFHEL